MTTVVPCSTSIASLIPGTAFTIRKNNHLTRCSLPKKSRKHTLSSQKFALPLPSSIKLFPKSIHVVSATGTETNVVAEEISSEISADASGDPSKHSRPSRKNKMQPVTNEELVPGATFTGKVKSIQPFGAFVDFGAFTDGLVHVSQLSDSFVKDVASVVSVGQEVTVKLVEVNTETSRISLTMRENSNTSSDKPMKMSKFVKGQELQGTIKSLTQSGCFISLLEGEGFLPHSEETDDGLGSMMGGPSLEVGQEVTVRVLRYAKGKVTLTMKKEEEGNELEEELSRSVVHTATNPFMLAFRRNTEISAFLDDREKVVKESMKLETSV